MMHERNSSRGASPGDTRQARAANSIGETSLGGASTKLSQSGLHMTGKGLSPEDFRAQHRAHDHEADFSGDVGAASARGR